MCTHVARSSDAFASKSAQYRPGIALAIRIVGCQPAKGDAMIDALWVFVGVCCGAALGYEFGERVERRRYYQQLSSLIRQSHAQWERMEWLSTRPDLALPGEPDMQKVVHEVTH